MIKIEKIIALVMGAVVLAIPGVFMLLATPATGLEAGAHVLWDASTSSGHCLVRYHAGSSSGSQNGFRPGTGPQGGGIASIHACSDMNNAINLCDSKIEDEFDCHFTGAVANDCGDPLCLF